MAGSDRVEFANTLRGIAAVCVLIEHYFAFYTGDRGVVASLINAPALSLSQQSVPYYLTVIDRVPHLIPASLGVALFFVISGFVIPLALMRENRRQFAISRVFRILPVYAVGFSITLLSIYFITNFYGREWPFTWAGVLPHYVPGLRDLFNVPHIDGILWTLEVEIKFYLICILALPLFKRRSLLVFVFPVVAVALYLGCFYAFGPEIIATPAYSLPFVAFMFIGVALNFFYHQAIKLVTCASLMLAVFLLFLTALKLGPISDIFIISWSYGYAVALFVFAMAFPAPFGKTKISEFFASVSYPLYVVHGIFGYALLRALSESGIGPAVALPATIICALSLAYLIHVTIEEPSRLKAKTLMKMKVPHHAIVAAPTVDAVNTLEPLI